MRFILLFLFTFALSASAAKLNDWCDIVDGSGTVLQTVLGACAMQPSPGPGKSLQTNLTKDPAEQAKFAADAQAEANRAATKAAIVTKCAAVTTEPLRTICDRLLAL